MKLKDEQRIPCKTPSCRLNKNDKCLLEKPHIDGIGQCLSYYMARNHPDWSIKKLKEYYDGE